MMNAQTPYEALYTVRHKLFNEEGLRLFSKILKIEERDNNDDLKHLYRDMRRKLRLPYNEIKRYE